MKNVGNRSYDKPQLKVHGKVTEFTKGALDPGSDIDEGRR